VVFFEIVRRTSLNGTEKPVGYRQQYQEVKRVSIVVMFWKDVFWGECLGFLL